MAPRRATGGEDTRNPDLEASCGVESSKISLGPML